MFIFDAGQIKKTVRGMRLRPCKYCSKETAHDLIEVGFYVTAMEIPLAPYKKRYTLICQVCGGGDEIPRAEFDRLCLHFEEEEKRKSFTHDYEKTRQESKKFCRECGARIKMDAKFCNDCGADLTQIPKSSGEAKNLANKQSSKPAVSKSPKPAAKTPKKSKKKGAPNNKNIL